MNENNSIYFHIDVNSAYLSWHAVKMLQYGSDIDIRTIPAAIGGSEENRHGIILAASIPAKKKFGIKTGDTIYEAKIKYRELLVYPPNYNWYMKSSNSLYELLKEYSNSIERFSIDENFMDATHLKDDYMRMAMRIKMRITKELGFNCNIGISENKLLSKMASDFQPKDCIHTLFKEEVPLKMWPLPVEDLMCVGRSTSAVLRKYNICTIGELANTDPDFLIRKFKSHGKKIYEYAHGIDRSVIKDKEYFNENNSVMKSIGNSETIKYDIENKEDAFRILLSLTESVASRLRENNSLCNVVVISIKTSDFLYYSHQKPLHSSTDSTLDIYEGIKAAFLEIWNREKIRQLGVRVTNLRSNNIVQENFFDFEKKEKQRKLDETVDSIRKRYGKGSVIRSTFLHSGVKPFSGGTGSEEDYIMMRSIL